MSWPHRYKSAYSSYRIIKGQTYVQWSDEDSLEQCQKENPKEHFIARKLKDGTIRIFKQAKVSQVSADR